MINTRFFLFISLFFCVCSQAVVVTNRFGAVKAPIMITTTATVAGVSYPLAGGNSNDVLMLTSPTTASFLPVPTVYPGFDWTLLNNKFDTNVPTNWFNQTSTTTIASDLFIKREFTVTNQFYSHIGATFSTNINAGAYHYYQTVYTDFNVNLGAPFGKSFICNGDWEMETIGFENAIQVYQNGVKIIDTKEPVASDGDFNYLRVQFATQAPRQFTVLMGDTQYRTKFIGFNTTSNTAMYPFNPPRLRVAIVHDSTSACDTPGCPSRLYSPWQIAGDLLGWDVGNYSITGTGFAKSASTSLTNYLGRFVTVTNFQPDVIIFGGSVNDGAAAAAGTLGDFMTNTFAGYAACLNRYGQPTKLGVLGKFPTSNKSGEEDPTTLNTISNVTVGLGYPYTRIPYLALNQYGTSNAWSWDGTHFNSNAVQSVGLMIVGQILSDTNFMKQLGISVQNTR